jgi:hypothetical protein
MPYKRSGSAGESLCRPWAIQGHVRATYRNRGCQETQDDNGHADILRQGGNFTLLPCANNITIGTEEIASLVTPIFYQDDRSNTFYIEPSFKEQRIEEWQEWVTRTPVPESEWDHREWWDKLLVEAVVPKPKLPTPVNPADPLWRQEIDPRARFDMVDRQDWLANPATVMQFDGELVGPTGHAGLASRPESE